MTDQKIEREGIALGMAEVAIGDLSGARLWFSPSAIPADSAFGVVLFSHIRRFDIGLVANRKAPEVNLAGIHLKGDLLVGVNASWALHFCDDGSRAWNEVSAGIDYSFFSGMLVVSAEGYFAETGASSSADYIATAQDDRYFSANGYCRFNAVFAPDQFFSAQTDVFWNVVDDGCCIVPSAVVTMTSGISVSAFLVIRTGSGGDEFSADISGSLSAAIRLTASL